MEQEIKLRNAFEKVKPILEMAKKILILYL